MRRIHRVFILIGVMVLSLQWALFAFAWQSKDTMFRCGTDLIDIGDSKSRVAHLCGPPFLKEVIGHTELPQNKGGVEFIVERWTYDTSIRYFTILTFKGDRLVMMEDERKR
ncbi:MAG: DUF2845 domain-containing protein [Desulfobacterales bacterium]|nr:DUF2845 domain-containing protein [Desulfobacterales bacterium]